MDKLVNFIKSTLAGSAQIREATQGRVYPFTVAQGIHDYPLIWWNIVTDSTIADDIGGSGAAWQAEVQVDVFARDVPSAAKLGGIVCAAFNSAPLTAGILSCYSNEIVPAYADEDETIHYAVRIFVNHEI